MPLTCVTITGADDSTDPAKLVELTNEFPFVEWGILVGSRTAKVAAPEDPVARMPSAEWIRELIKAREQTENRMKLSLHVCGRLLREITAGRSSLDELLGPQLFAFSRVQLNFHGKRQPKYVGDVILTAFCELDRGGMGWDPQLIFQLDGVNNRLWGPSGTRFSCVGLFDRSHGNGVLPEEWPQCSTDIACGWAGGLGPENLAEEIPKITAKSWSALNFWIDMDTKVRSDDDTELDLNRVRQCLEIAAPFVNAAAAV